VTSTKDGRAVDRTNLAKFETLSPKVIAVSADGIVTPIGDGIGTVVVRVDGAEARATIQVIDGARDLPGHLREGRAADPRPLRLQRGSVPWQGGGQNGFQLSLLGFDADFDFAA